MKYLKITFLSLLLVGCSQVNNVQVKPSDLSADPSWPSPVKPVKVNWVVTNIENTPYVGLTYKDSLDLRIWLEDIKRYIVDVNNMVCYYRTPLKEERCFESKNNPNSGTIK